MSNERPTNGTNKEYLVWLRGLLTRTQYRTGSLDLPGMTTYHLPPLSQQTKSDEETSDA